MSCRNAWPIAHGRNKASGPIVRFMRAPGFLEAGRFHFGLVLRCAKFRVRHFACNFILCGTAGTKLTLGCSSDSIADLFAAA